MSALRFSPAADRNKQPILEQLQRLLPERGHALEIASGTGQHIVWFARKLTGWTWQPSDLPANDLAGISSAVHEAGLPNVLPVLAIDVRSHRWPLEGSEFEALFDLIYCANMLHISPWETCSGLMQGSARHLSPGGLLVLYGPYLEDDVVTSDGNQAFDESLRASNPSWGLRNLPAVIDEAARYGFVLRERCQMPANNLLLVWTIA
jgi:SAM-dependent methyltransferase